jgi:predicted nucleic acid-binding protein
MVAPFLDTNIFVYSITDDRRAEVALGLLADPFVTSVQALNEFANVAFRKQGLQWSDIRALTQAFQTLADAILPIAPAMHFQALALSEAHQLSFYDALMLAVALDAGCSVFYSEDMHNGVVIREQLRVVDPFRKSPDPSSSGAAP